MQSYSAPLRGRFSFQPLLTVLGGILFLAGWLAPNHYPPWTSFHNEAALFAALIAFCFGAVFDSKAVRLPTTTLVFFGLLILIVWLQVATGQIMYGGDALVSSLYLIGIALAWWLGARSALVSPKPDDDIVIFAVLMVVAATASAFLAVLQWLQLEASLGVYAADRGPSMRPYANLAQPNLLATLLVMGVVFSYLLFVYDRIRGWQLAALVTFLSFGLIATESRAGILSAICVGIFLTVRSKSAGKTGVWRVVMAWWGLLAALRFLWQPLNEVLLLQAARQEAMAVDSVRLVIWKQIIAAISSSPWVGYGWRQTMVAQKTGIETVPGSAPTDYAHSVVLDVLAWVGLPLGIVLIAVVGWWILRTIRGLKDSSELLLFIATIPFFVHSMLEFPFAYAFFLFPVAWVFGHLQATQMPWQFCIREHLPRWEKVLVVGGLLGFAVLCSQVLLEYLVAEEDCRVMRFEMRNVGTKPMDYAAPQLVLLTQLDEMLKMGRIKPDRGMSVTDIERMRKANASLAWASLHLKYVIALGLNGQPEEATRQLRNIELLYGKVTYKSAADELGKIREEKYPELSLVRIQ